MVGFSLLCDFLLMSKLIFDNIVLISTGFVLTAMFVMQLMLYTGVMLY